MTAPDRQPHQAKEDVDYLPIFTREGASWGKLNKVYGGKLETIITEINTAIAA